MKLRVRALLVFLMACLSGYKLAQAAGTTVEYWSSNKNANTHSLTGLPTPSAGSDACTKTYADTKVASVSSSTGLTCSGSTTVTCSLDTPVSLAHGGTAQASAAAARGSSGLNVDGITSHGDSDYSIAATDRLVITSAAFTAARVWTLPAANAVNGGQSACVMDLQGTVTSTNTLTIARAGSDTINGATSYILASARDGICVYSDGSSKWVSVRLGIEGGGTAAATASGTALDNISGFSSTGILKRTGAGAYSFLADPLPVANGGTAGATRTAAFDNLAPASPSTNDMLYFDGSHWVSIQLSTGVAIAGGVIVATGASTNGNADPTWAGTYKSFLYAKMAPAAGHSMHCRNQRFSDSQNWVSNLTTMNSSWHNATFGGSGSAGLVTVATDTSLSGGVYRLDTGATGSSSALIDAAPTAGTGYPSIIATNTSHWGACGLFRSTTSVDAHTLLYFGLGAADDTAGLLYVGIVGTDYLTNGSTTKYSGGVNQGITTAIQSGVTIDTGWHTCCFTDNATNQFISCDSESWVSGTRQALTSATKPIVPSAKAVNGATAASRKLDLEETLYCWQSN